MSVSETRTVNDLYEFVRRPEAACLERGATELHKKLDTAMKLGSSGLEILGAIRGTILANRLQVEEILGPGGREEIVRVLTFVNKAFGH